MDILQTLEKQNLINAPKWLVANTHYLCLMGSQAYGVATKDSDWDVYGFAMPPKHMLLPHLNGYIRGFGTPPPNFEQFATKKPVMFNKREYEFNVYSIVKYFELCRSGNPNMIDSLFVRVPEQLKVTNIGQMVLGRRHLFLSKQVWATFKGYAYSQVHKMKGKQSIGKRKVEIERYGYSLKFAYHIVRLLDEVEQLLETGEMDLMRSKETLKSIRRGDWSEEQILSYFDNKVSALEKVYDNCKLPAKAPESELRELLLNCLEEHYGKLDMPRSDSIYKNAIDEIKSIVGDL